LEWEASAAPHASAQYPSPPQVELHSSQVRPVIQAKPPGAQRMETLPSQRRVSGRQSTQRSVGSQASSHSVCDARERPSSPHT